MQNLGDLKESFLLRNQTSTLVAFYTDTILNTWIDDAHKFCAGYKKWTSTEGRASTTFASLVTNEDGYLRGEYPEGWKSDSIRLMKIGGKEVGKRDFYKFTKFLEDYDSDDERIFSDYHRQYYVNPNIDLSGTVTVWGQFTPASLGGDPTATTVFSGSEEEANEAIVEIMMSYARKREKKLNESIAHINEAKRILEELWLRIKDEQFAYQSPPGDGIFKRFDVIEGGFLEDIFKRDQFS